MNTSDHLIGIYTPTRQTTDAPMNLVVKLPFVGYIQATHMSDSTGIIITAMTYAFLMSMAYLLTRHRWCRHAQKRTKG